MEPDEWTPAYGWKIALGKSALRCGIIFVVLTLGLYVVYPDVEFGLGGIWTIMLIAGVVAGSFIGWGVAQKLPDASGLEARRIVLPVVAMLLIAEVAACCLAAALRGGSVVLLLVPFGGLIVWSSIVAVLVLLVLK